MKFACCALIFMLCWLTPGRTESASRGSGAGKMVEQPNLSKQEEQNQIDAWSSEREELLSRICDLNNQLEYVRAQRERYAADSAKQQENIRRIEQKQQGLKTLQGELEPYLNEVFVRLTRFVESDLPFLQEERAKRLSFIGESLGDYHLTASEKLRRLLEALQVEADYGRHPEVDEAFIDLAGKPTKVRLLRLGRLVIYYLTIDGQAAGRYDVNSGGWEELSGDSVPEIKSAIQMIGKSRTMELVNLPVAR